MNKKFRYDYTHKFIFINIFLIPIFLAIFFALYSKEYALYVIWGIGLGDYLFKTFVFTFNQGITVKKSYIKVVDNLSIFKIKWDTLDYVEFKELKKKKKDNLYGFFHEFFTQEHICLVVIMFIIMVKYLLLFFVKKMEAI